MTWFISAIAFARRVPGFLTPAGWAAVAVLILFLAFGAWCAAGAAEGERDRQATEAARIERKGSTGRETAAGERAIDTTTINARERERHDATASLPDTRPSDRRIARACVQLRQQGTAERDLPVICRSGG